MSTQLLAEFPELSSLTREDLEDLLRDPVYFQAVFHSLNRVKSMFQAQTELCMANEAIAKKNLGLQNDCYRLRSETQSAFDEARSLEARWKEVDREQKELYQRFTPSFLLMRLRHAITAQDELSEQLASSFVKSAPSTSAVPNEEIDEFVKQFKEQRKVFHKRAMYADRWSVGKIAWRED